MELRDHSSLRDSTAALNVANIGYYGAWPGHGEPDLRWTHMHDQGAVSVSATVRMHAAIID